MSDFLGNFDSTFQTSTEQDDLNMPSSGGGNTGTETHSALNTFIDVPTYSDFTQSHEDRMSGEPVSAGEEARRDREAERGREEHAAQKEAEEAGTGAQHIISRMIGRNPDALKNTPKIPAVNIQPNDNFYPSENIQPANGLQPATKQDINLFVIGGIVVIGSALMYYVIR